MDRIKKIVKSVTGSKSDRRSSDIAPTGSSTRGKETGGPARKRGLQFESDETKNSWGQNSSMDMTQSDREGASNTKKGKEVAEDPSQIEQARVKAERLKDAQIYIWKGLLDADEVKHLMETGKVVRSKDVRDDSTRVKEIMFDSGITCIFKANRNYFGGKPHEVEIDTYYADRLFKEFKKVPLTIEYKFNDETGSLQLKVNDLKPLSPDEELPPEVNFFLLAIHHRDFKGNINIGRTPANELVLYDNESAFSTLTHLRIDDISKYIPNPCMLEEARALNMEKLESMRLPTERKHAFLLRCRRLIQAIDEANASQGVKNITEETSL